MRRMLLTTTVIVLALVVAACGDDTSSGNSPSIEPTVAPSSLDGTFTSTEVTGHDLVAGSSITLTFAADDLAFHAGCNQMGGKYRIDGTELRLDGPARATMMGCEPDLQTQDEWLTALLDDGVEFELDGSQLTLTSGDVAIQLESA